MGATHTIDSSPRRVDPVEEIKRICAETYAGADGADVVVEAVGRPETWQQAFYARDLAGTLVLVGVPTPDMKVPDIPLIDVFGRGGALKSSWYGDCLPSRDFPMLVDLYRQGRLDLDAFVSEEIGLGDVEAAFEKMHGARQTCCARWSSSDGRDHRAAAGVRVDHAVSSGTFSLDGETFDVDNNIWVVGDDTECVVIDAPHAVDDILAVVGDRRVKAIVCTHAHDDHVRVAPALRERANDGSGAPILLHPDDRPLWELTHGGPDTVDGHLWDVDLADGMEHRGRGHHPDRAAHAGPRPGRGLLLRPELGCVFTGDTLFQGGPGRTGRSFSDRPTLEASIRARLFAPARRHRRPHRPR